MIIIIKMDFCIYRNCNSCNSCQNFVIGNMKYCNSHYSYKNYLYEIIYQAIQRRSIESNNDIYEIYKYIYDNSSIFTKEFIFKGCLKILFSKKEYLLNLFSFIEIDNNNYDRNKIIDIIFKLNKNTYEIEKKNYKNFLIIYRLFMKKIINKYYYNPEIKLNNVEDPFTLETLNDLNKSELFIYNENKDNTYFFIAKELKYFIDTNGNWNPYTKEKIPLNVIRNLNYFIKINKLNNKKVLNKYEWSSIPQAFTDVSKIMEKVGFYNDVKWFLKFTSNQIKNIIKTYRIMTRECENNVFFNNINDNTIFYDFAREIIVLFETGNDNFNLCYYFVKSLSLYSEDFYNNIPEWMSDNINTNANTITIPLNNIFSNIDILYFINIINDRE